ncbi:RNA polymerase sigma factor [Hymenobacter profundi]|uniref:Sigma-70 family RNA polymerase sigma factor n=1 Tax=Hymenobacter profundi TaxID=1982110 RepID=A0ABS6WZ68_9BACT|nr:sigma-70 family RNA polymerase sigma factor [Hymenobacter profundi]MBW3128895.1 sigma-70 family RNA polymerase sigma factor [Hymenobacter profundi]
MYSPPPSHHEQRHDDDVALWQAFRAGQQEALGALFDRYAQQLFSYGHHLIHDAEVVKDAIQTVFVHLWARRDHLGEVTTVKFYLYRSLKNELLRVASSARPAREQVVEDYEPSIEQSLVDTEEEHQQAMRLRLSLAQLSGREKEIINLKYFSNFKIREIATMLQLNEQTVANLLSRALKKLRQSLLVSVLLWLLG